MVGLAKSEIDELCENYEDFRTPDNCGPGSIHKFLENMNLQHSVQPFLMSELIQIDIQLNWMSWDKNLARLLENSEVSKVLQALLKIPRMTDYIWFDLQHPSILEHDVLLKMAECEMESREQWGDAIGATYYKSKFGILLPRDPHCPIVNLACRSDETSRFREVASFSVRGMTVFGRQRSTDPDELLEEESAEGNRIIVACKTDATISREQLAVQVLSRRYAIVTNLSNVNAVDVEGVGPLQPANSIVVAFDFSVRLPSKRLKRLHFQSSRK
jgi:hypothetical protein